MKTILRPAFSAGPIFVALLFVALPIRSEPPAKPEKSREFRFVYAATVKGLAKGQAARIWLPVPPSNEEQQVTTVEQRLPARGQLARETKYGNQILYLEARADEEGKIPLALTYRVKRKEVHADFQARVRDHEDVDLFLRPNARVPITGKPLTLLEGKELPRDQLQRAHVLYDVVRGHMRYSKQGVGWGQGDAVWACDSKYGNCTDFHSLFISLSRSQKIPAKFEIGFLLPETRGKGDIAGYHCWAKCKPEGKGWLPVDISEARKNPQMKEYYFGNLTADRVAFSVGRDLILVPKQQGRPLNFFIYPYVEVKGKAWPDDKIERRFTYRDEGQ